MTKRLPIFLALTALAGAAAAETYVAKIYGVPSGVDSMVALGAGNGGMMAGYTSLNNYNYAATLTPQGFRNLHPSGWTTSQIVNSWGGTYHVGYGHPSEEQPTTTHALFWIGGGPAIDLHPNDPNILSSSAHGGDGQYQCGLAGGACVWNRTAASYHRLSAWGYTSTKAMAMDVSVNSGAGMRVVGFGTLPNISGSRAIVWKGRNERPTSLHPAGAYQHSLALACSATVQAGYVEGAATGSKKHAAKWSGSAVSFMDINPSGFLESRVTSVRGQMLVGFGKPATSPARTQAVAWTNNSAANTWINLHARLPYPFQFWSSWAWDIDDQGNVIGYVESPDHSVRRPVIWHKVASF